MITLGIKNTFDISQINLFLDDNNYTSENWIDQNNTLLKGSGSFGDATWTYTNVSGGGITGSSFNNLGQDVTLVNGKDYIVNILVKNIDAGAIAFRLNTINDGVLSCRFRFDTKFFTNFNGSLDISNESDSSRELTTGVYLLTKQFRCLTTGTYRLSVGESVNTSQSSGTLNGQFYFSSFKLRNI